MKQNCGVPFFHFDGLDVNAVGLTVNRNGMMDEWMDGKDARYLDDFLIVIFRYLDEK